MHLLMLGKQLLVAFWLLFKAFCVHCSALLRQASCSAACLALKSQPMVWYIIVCSALCSLSSVPPTVVSFCAGARHCQ
jgi:hypothetical protein